MLNFLIVNAEQVSAKVAKNMKYTEHLVNWALKNKTSNRKRKKTRFQSAKITRFADYADNFIEFLMVNLNLS